MISAPAIVIPAQAGIHLSAIPAADWWVPAFAGTTFSPGIR